MRLHRIASTLLPLALALAACAPAEDTEPAAEAEPAPQTEQEASGSPAVGYDIHVTAPHVVHGEVMGPFHHYCKVISPEPIIQCILFETTDPAAPMTEVEYIVAKSITRDRISREEWNVAWQS